MTFRGHKRLTDLNEWLFMSFPLCCSTQSLTLPQRLFFQYHNHSQINHVKGVRLSSWVVDYTFSAGWWWWLRFQSSLGYQSHMLADERACYSTLPPLLLLSGGAWWSPSGADTEMTWVILPLAVPCRFRTGSSLFACRVWHAPLWDPRSPRDRCTADNTYISIYSLLITQSLANFGERSTKPWWNLAMQSTVWVFNCNRSWILIPILIGHAMIIGFRQASLEVKGKGKGKGWQPFTPNVAE